MTPTLVALRELGDVESVNLTKKDVTGAAQDLDARIHAMELSVDRMTNLLATATTHDDIIAAENALTEREAALEQLRSQRAAIAEQVSLSTIHVAIVGPDLPPYVAPPAPVEPPTGPQSFVEGLVTGLGLPGRRRLGDRHRPRGAPALARLRRRDRGAGRRGGALDPALARPGDRRPSRWSAGARHPCDRARRPRRPHRPSTPDQHQPR